MRKKAVLLFLIIFVLCGKTAVFATTLERAVSAVAEKLFIETQVDKNILRNYSDWGFIDKDYIEVFAGALHSGLLSPKSKVLNPKGEDLSSLIRGLIRFSAQTASFDLIGFSGAEQKTFTPETVFITSAGLADELIPKASSYYYALVNKGGRTYVVWEAAEEQAVWLFRGMFFLKEGNEYIIKGAQKKYFSSWADIDDLDYVSVVLEKGTVPRCRDGSAAENINLECLDKAVYILGRHNDDKIIACYFEIE